MRKGIPATISRFEVVGQLGRGGMGAVYRGRDLKIDRPVAIKILGVHADDDTLRARFLQEARSAGRLHHPNIVTIYEYGEHDGDPYIAMEFVDGLTLSQVIATQGRLGLSTAMDYLRQIASALDYAHDHDVVHRDIKPANIMIAGNRLKILDFGIARMSDSSLTNSGVTIGTPNYMSPEQVRGQTVDRRSDIFAVGVVFYELLAGVQAFPGTAIHPVMNAVANEPPASLHDLVPNLDPGIVAAVNRAIEKEASRRFPTLAEMVGQLDEVARSRPVDPVAVAFAGATKSSEIEVPPRPATDAVEPHFPDAMRLDEEGKTAIPTQAAAWSAIVAPPRFRVPGLAASAKSVFDVQQDVQQAEWLAGARGFLDEGDTEHAIELVKRVLEVNPGSVEALRIRETVYDLRRARPSEEPAAGDSAPVQAVASAVPAERPATRDDLADATPSGWLIVPPGLMPERTSVFESSPRQLSRPATVIREVTERGGREWFAKDSISGAGKAASGAGLALSIALHVLAGGVVTAVLATSVVPILEKEKPIIVALAPLEVPPPPVSVARPRVPTRAKTVDAPVAPIQTPTDAKPDPVPAPPPPPPVSVVVTPNNQPVVANTTIVMQAPPPLPPPKTVEEVLLTGWDTDPVAIRKVNPKIPAGAKGFVYVRVVISTEGKVERPRVLTATPYAALIIEAALASQFKPATRGGKPVAVEVTITFSLETK